MEDNDVCDGRPGGSHPREGSPDERTGRPSTQVTHATQVRIAPRWLDMGSRLEETRSRFVHAMVCLAFDLGRPEHLLVIMII